MLLIIKEQRMRHTCADIQSSKPTFVPRVTELHLIAFVHKKVNSVMISELEANKAIGDSFD